MKNHIEHSKSSVEAQYKNVVRDKIKHYHFPSIDSTNTWAKSNPDQWSDTGVTLITASEQTRGRGRFTRTWFSPKDQNVYATFCLFLGSMRPDIGQIPQLMALSAVQMLKSYDLAACIKWPNDVLSEGKKIAGILCETIGYEDKIGLLCGIGLNVNMTSDEIARIDQPANSMFTIKGREFSVSEVTEKLVLRFIVNWRLFSESGFEPFFEEFQKYFSLRKGQAIRIANGKQVLEGDFVGLNKNGSIGICLPSGQIKHCTSGEITG